MAHEHVQSGNAFIFCGSCMGVLAPTGETTQRKVDHNLCKSNCVRKKTLLEDDVPKKNYMLTRIWKMFSVVIAIAISSTLLIGVLMYFAPSS